MKALHLLAAAAVAAALLVLPHFLKNYGIYLLSYWLIYIIATMGLNLTVGYAGQKSLGHAAFFGIGAYTAGLLAARWGWSEPLSGLLLEFAGIVSCSSLRTSTAAFALGIKTSATRSFGSAATCPGCR